MTDGPSVAPSEDGPTTMGPLSLLKTSWNAVLAVKGRLFLLVILSNLVLTALAFPLAHWVFREALRADGMYAIDMSDFAIAPGFPITVLLLAIALLIVLLALVVEFAAILLLLHDPSLTWKQLGREVLRVGKKVFHPSSVWLALYLLVLVPLSGFGFTSAALNGVAVPNFITEELDKQTFTRVALVVLYVILGYINIRLAATLPIFVLSKESQTRALSTSWRITRGLRPWTLIVAAVVLIAALSALSVAGFYLVLAPTFLADNFAPSASPVVAGLSFGAAQVLSLLLTGFAVAFLAGILTAYAAAHTDKVKPFSQTPEPKKSKRIGLANTVIAVGAAAVMGALAIPTMYAISDHPETIVIAHRGFTQGGVENTIEALEAANAAGAEIVEFDTMQTKDGRFVVMHDTDLGRLTGTSVKVKDLTLDELTAMTVHDNAGNTGQIPSLVEYVTRANELDQQLLIELKLSGAETETHVQDLLDTLNDHDLLEGHLFHTLDRSSADELKTLLPNTTIGYIMPFAGLGIPQTHADFLVLEESSANSAMQRNTADAGLGYVVWTVNTKEALNIRMIEGADAVITDRPDWGLTAREHLQEESGLAGRLSHIMASLFTV